MDATPGRYGRLHKGFGPAVLAATLALLAAMPVPSAQAGPIRRPWPAPVLSRPQAQALRADAWPRLTRSALPLRASQAARGPGGPMAAYVRHALQVQTLQVAAPPAPRAMQLTGNGMLPDGAFLDYLQWRRSLNPARFDRHHPVLAQVLRRGQYYGPPVPVCPPPMPVYPPPPVMPQTVRPSAEVPTPPVPPPVTYPVPQLNPPPVVPEPSSGLVLAALFGAGWWARRWRSRRTQGPDRSELGKDEG